MVLSVPVFISNKKLQKIKSHKIGQLAPPAGHHKGWVIKGDIHFNLDGWQYPRACPSLHQTISHHIETIIEENEDV